MGDVIVGFEVVEVDGVRDARNLVKVLEVPVEIGVIDDAAQVAFEMAVIHGVKTDDGDEEPPIGFQRYRYKEISPLRETLFQCVECRKHLICCAFVDRLRRSKPSAVDTIVDSLVD